MTTKKTLYWVLGAAAVIIIGIIVIPPLMKKYGNKMYKSSVKNDKIDFDNLGPEIVKKDKTDKDAEEE